ncbi:MAG: 2-oxo acid dehydrogenase subunit E2 [Actinomycetia bacterium]|nr:2-oxo acid dehydrogenase subunit E2 [Actinomycetes bacterium]MCP4958759.1 2-oxo acid dehydrogenase subunit E2 [Actinomycetes bacterium]
MATEFVMPKLGLTMEEGTIAEWRADDGEQISAGTPVLLITTDKTDSDVEAPASGRLFRVGRIGRTYACGDLIGWILAEGEDPPQSAEQPPVPSEPRLFASPNARRLAAEAHIDLWTISGTGPGGRIVSEDLLGAQPSSPTPDPITRPPTPRPVPLATAAARSLADLIGIDISTVPVDPREGRATRETVASHIRTLLKGRAAPEPTSLGHLTQAPTEIVPLAGMRGTIARRMYTSLQQMAQLTMFVDGDLTAVVSDREARKSTGPAPSLTDYVIAAVARALADHPMVNSQVTDDGIALLPGVQVGMAVAIDGGLIVPVVHNTLEHGLPSLSVETSRLAVAARGGSLELSELEGGTFSVTSLGMHGVDGFTPIINPPNAAILGVGRLRSDVDLDDTDNPIRVQRMTLSLTWDHRVFDGVAAAEFCRSITAYLDDPESLDRPVLSG